MPNLKFSKENIASDFYSVRPEFVLLSWLFSITMAYLIELGVAKRLFSSRIGTVLHIVMGALNLVLPILWVPKSHTLYQNNSFILHHSN